MNLLLSVRKILSAILLCLSLLYMFFTVKENSNDFTLDITLNYGELLIAFIIATIAGLLNASTWFYLLRKSGENNTFKRSYLSWSISRIYRYLPGKIFSYLARIEFQKASTKTKTTLVMIIEMLANFIAVAIVAFLALSMSTLIKGYTLEIVVFSLLLLFSTFSLLFSKKLLKAISPELHIISQEALNLKNIISTVYLIIPIILLYGVSHYYLLNAISDTHFDILTVTTIIYFASILGMLAIFSPAGIGVKDGALMFMLIKLGLHTQDAILFTILSRILLISSELLNFAFASLLMFKVKE